MNIAQSLLMEFDQEISATRRHLERVPEDKLDWRPHPKSMTLGQLALHVAGSLGPIAEMATRTENETPGPDFPAAGSRDEILAALDESIGQVHSILPAFTDEQMGEMISFLNEGKIFISLPRIAVLRTILLNHHYHHRAQLGVYLRLLNADVPSTYGPSADEQMQVPAEVAS